MFPVAKSIDGSYIQDVIVNMYAEDERLTVKALSRSYHQDHQHHCKGSTSNSKCVKPCTRVVSADAKGRRASVTSVELYNLGLSAWLKWAALCTKQPCVMGTRNLSADRTTVENKDHNQSVEMLLPSGLSTCKQAGLVHASSSAALSAANRPVVKGTKKMFTVLPQPSKAHTIMMVSIDPVAKLVQGGACHLFSCKLINCRL